MARQSQTAQQSVIWINNVIGSLNPSKVPVLSLGEYSKKTKVSAVTTIQIRALPHWSNECIFMLMGELIEHARTEDLFLTPKNPKTAEYIEGRYG